VNPQEYVAAQDPDDPGVLVLSRFAGAANELTSALIVNPYDRDDVAAALNQALTMSRTERISRYNDMMTVLRNNDITHWRESYLADLQAIPQQGRAQEKENNVAAFPKLA